MRGRERGIKGVRTAGAYRKSCIDDCRWTMDDMLGEIGNPITQQFCELEGQGGVNGSCV